MKIKLVTAMALSSLLVGVTACGGSGDSRTRNAALAPCEGSAVDAASREYMATLSAELGDLLTVLQVDEVFVVSAQAGLAEARAAGTEELTQAVREFDSIEGVVNTLDAHIQTSKANGSWNVMGSEMRNLWVRELALARTKMSSAKAEMERLIVQKATALEQAVDMYNAAVKKRDESRAAYNSAAESYNSVVLISSGRNCPVLSAGDAETYVRDVAATTPPTTAPRLKFDFIDEPAPPTVPPQTGEVDEASGGENGDSSTPETTIPDTTVPAEISDASTTTTSTVPENSDSEITMDTLPIPAAPPSVEYVAPTLQEILEDISQRIESFGVDTPLSGQNVELVIEILESIRDVSAKISSGVYSPSFDQIVIFTNQINLLLVITTIAKKKSNNNNSSENSSIRKFSVSVSASGFSPGSDVVFADPSGRKLRQTKANKEGTALFDADVDSTTDRDVFILGGRNSAGDVVAVPVLVEFEENSDTSASTVPNSDTDSTVVDNNDPSTTNNSSSNAWIIWLLVIGALLAIAYGIRKIREQRQRDVNQTS